MDHPFLTLKSLPPKWARFCLQTEAFVRDELGLDLTGKTLVLGLSRGVDSTALALWAYLVRPRLQIRLLAAHLHHGLREQAGPEENSLRDLCQELEIWLRTGHTAVRTFAARRGLGVEEAGRTLRYRFLTRTGHKCGADFLLTAHHLNDLAEDMLMRQIRGTGWPALAGMPAWEPSASLVRPFLLTPKHRLRDFVLACGQTWMEDTSNLDQTFTRNRIRHRILPLLLDENPKFLEQTATIWRQAQVDKDFWDRDLQVHACLEHPLPHGLLLPAAHLHTLHPAQRLRWYRDVLARLGPGQALAGTLFQLDRAWENKSWAKRFQFPGGKEILVTPDGLLCTAR